MMDPRVKPAGDGTRFNRSLDDFRGVPNSRWRWGFPTRAARRECRPASARSRRGVGGSAKACRRKSSPSPKAEALAATARAGWEPVWEKWQEELSAPEMLGPNVA